MNQEENVFIPEDQEIFIEKEEEQLYNPFCQLNKKQYEKECGMSFEQCYTKNKFKKVCNHYSDKLSEEQEAMRLLEIERLDRIKEKYKKKAAYIERLKGLMEKKSDLVLGFGCCGCLFWIAFLIAGVAAGIYAIKWAWWLLLYVWNLQI